jgi:hypothetical protein
MFPDLTQVRDKAVTRFGELSTTTGFRLAIASLLLVFHLAAFVRAGHSRLGVEFNSTPDEAPYFSDPDAPATQGYPRQPHRWSRLVVSRLDAQHYIGTAERGLSACPKDPSSPDGAYLDCGLGWLPAWGTIGGVVADATHMASDKALMFLSIVAALALNLMWTSPILVKRLGRGVAWATLIGFNIYPSAFYLVTPYSEAATLALAIGGFIALANERWVIAALLVGASTAFDTPALAFAIALGCALLFAAYRRREQKLEDWWRPLLGLPLCFWGQLATMLVLQIVLGDWSAFLRARHAFGATHEWGRLFDVTYYVKGLAGQDMDVVFLLAFVTIIALTARELLKKFTSVENVFLVVASGVTIVLSIIAVPQYWGITRYLMLCPMAFFGIGLMARKYTVLFVLWCVLCLAFYWHVELCDYITQGNSTVCPCLGRIEFGMPFGS